MNIINTVTITGLVHHLSRKKDNNYFPFSIRHENTWTDGTTRKDFLNARASLPELQEALKALPENSPVRIKGTLRSSKGSGELYLAVLEAEPLSELPALPENSVQLSGNVHFVKAQPEGENATGKYIRFAVRQDNPETGLDFIVVRVYDDEQKTVLQSLKDKDPVHVEGTLRSSRGSGVNYVRCVKIGQ
ncbi:MAG: OB-fold nucleic acid binding domain-containing protein [Synergistaceae bacterium]|nr:OB-fold nucleic acid binding domain-containing protein [Synergistaceae bacterium]